MLYYNQEVSPAAKKEAGRKGGIGMIRTMDIIDLNEHGDFRAFADVEAKPGEYTYHKGEYRAVGSEKWVQATLEILWGDGNYFENFWVEQD
jgi:hypothetical protein